MGIILEILSALARLRALIIEELFKSKIKKDVDVIEHSETAEDKQNAITDIREHIYNAKNPNGSRKRPE